jgi:NO-binding membrane sensor protein with MHYT domain
MLTVHNFSVGLVTPALAFIMSFIGSFLALRCTTRARVSTGRTRLGWLLAAAVSLGITGIWVMHFIAMLGFSIPGHTIQFNVLITLGSMLLSVVFVTCGLLFVGFGKVTTWSLLGAGTVTGFGVAGQHYTGMAAMVSNVKMSYNPMLFAVSVVIAIVASTAALWAALRLHSVWSTFGAAAIMGVAVSGMHYTGMAAMHVYAGPAMSMSGVSAVDFVLPLVVGVSALTFIMTATVALAPSGDEIASEADLMRRIEEVRAREPYSAPPPIVSSPQDRRTGKLTAFPTDSASMLQAPGDTNSELTLTE